MEQREISIVGGKIYITVEEVEGEHIIKIDGVEWVRTSNRTHAAVLYNMLADHITEYMSYYKKS